MQLRLAHVRHVVAAAVVASIAFLQSCGSQTPAFSEATSGQTANSKTQTGGAGAGGNAQAVKTAGSSAVSIQTSSNISVNDPAAGGSTGGSTAGGTSAGSNPPDWNNPVDVSTDPLNPPHNPNDPVWPNPGTDPNPIQNTIFMHCADGSSVATANITASVEARLELKVGGQFCPSSSKKTNILMIVDFSGSMSSNDNASNTTCGRLDAARAIYSRMQSVANSGDTINFAILPFASGIVVPYVVNFTSMADFSNSLTYAKFCRYIAGSGSGPSFLNQTEAGTTGNTNYQAAFQAAESMLTGLDGHQEVFFISDGQPTIPSADPVTPAVAAGASLRQNIGNLTMSSILLATNDPTAQNILAQVTGSPDRVALVADASQLATTILNFPAPTIDSASIAAVLSIAPYADHALPVADVNAAAGIWNYDLQPFILLGSPGQTTVNKVTVTASGSDGSKYTATITVNYTQK